MIIKCDKCNTACYADSKYCHECGVLLNKPVSITISIKTAKWLKDQILNPLSIDREETAAESAARKELWESLPTLLGAPNIKDINSKVTAGVKLWP